jgi:hypothetical protein
VPSSLPGLRVWLKADALAAGSVCTWPDASGNGFDAAQASMGACPTLSPSSIGGMPAVSFDGVDDVLLNTSSTVGPEHTICAVWRVEARDYEGWAFAVEPSGSFFSGFSHRRGAGSDRLSFETTSSNSGASISYATSSVGLGATPYLVCGTVSGGPGLQTVQLYVNGLLDEVGGFQDAPSVIPSRVGYSVGDMTIWGGVDGDIAEILVYDGALGDGQRQDVEAYLGQKYGL